ncbi:MAG: M28 family peptidase [Alteromonadaceae bacterium]|nr:M28 family peptidase [Alteromonadaceae bacterium]
MFKNSLKSFLFSIAAISSCSLLSVNAEVLTVAEKQQIEKLKNTALNSDLSYQIVESLTTEVGHRMMGTEGDKRSIKWAVNKMKALGFDKVWTEDVTGPKWLRGEVKASIVKPYPHDVVAIALGGSVGTGEQGITAEVIHFKTLNDLKAAAKGSLTGKIAFVSYQMDRHIDGDGYGVAVGTRVRGASVAAQKGAVALIMRSVGTDNNRFAHTGMTRYKDGIEKIPAAALSNPDADLLVNQFKRGKPVSFYLKLTSSRFSTETVKSANVIGEITGSEFPKELVVIGAHLDSWDVGTGAIDDGLGIGMVLASAHHLAQLPKRPKRTLRVILFAGEELGLLGAKSYMKKHKDEINTHVLGAEWDFGLGKIYKMIPGVGASSLNVIRELAQILAPMGVALSPQNNGRADSDMGMLTDAGMPSINFAPDGASYFDYHHTENDTLDKVNSEALKQNTAVYTVFAYFATQAEIDFRK